MASQRRKHRWPFPSQPASPYRGVQLAGAHRVANFSHESATLAAVLQQLAGLVLIARRFELDDFDLDIGSGRGQTPGDFLGLGQRHGALARTDPDSNCHHLRSNRRRRRNYD